MSDLKTQHGVSVSQVGSKGTIIDIVEEALKWRLEANNKKQAELIDDVHEKVTEQKRMMDLMTTESNNEFLELKNQIVEAAQDVLLQV